MHEVGSFTCVSMFSSQFQNKFRIDFVPGYLLAISAKLLGHTTPKGLTS